MLTKPHPFHAVLVLACLVLLSACGTRQISYAPGRTPPASWMNTPADVRDFPQDLNVYAETAGTGKRLMEEAEQADADARFNRIFFGPWDMSAPSVHKRDLLAGFRKVRGYKLDGRPWLQDEWALMERNAGLASFPSRREHAVTLRNTDLREMPTHEPRFARPTPDPIADPFDYFQYSLLPPGTPLLIVHTTLDGRWHFVECPVAAGWVSTRDVALADGAFKRVYRNGAYAALVRDGARLSDIQAGIGAVFPVKSRGAAGALKILFPVLGAGGLAEAAEAVLGAEDAVSKPLPLTPGNVARVGNAMMSQHYGWGGMFGNRDCSSLTRDLLTPFGIWLPRNSGAQSRRGLTYPLDGDAEAKEKRILADGIPFASLVGMRGHIMLYVGKYKGRAAMFHNTWGVRVVDGANDNARYVIGRTVVTSVTPGRELKNLYQGRTLGDRLESLTILTDRRF